MITFYPGPSKVYPQVAGYLQDAFTEGILSVNHRSPTCMAMVKETIELLHQQLNIPADYHIYFVSSATESWEIIAQSLITTSSYHFFNGAFGKKWHEYTNNLGVQAFALPFDFNESPSMPRGVIPKSVCCFTHNETSNGTVLQNAVLDQYQVLRQHQGVLLAIDTTSSMGGVELNWSLADVWFASVQKCFGLPAGLGVMVCSPQAIERAYEIGERMHYNSLLSIHENFQKYQTHYTPNVLAIYLLKRVMEQVPAISEVAAIIKKQATSWYEFIKNQTNFQSLVTNPALSSDTVIAIQDKPEAIKAIKLKCHENGITLGNGYGEWKDSTFRIANFPAIEAWEIEKLKEVLREE